VATRKFDTPEEQNEFVRIARSSGDRLEAIISDIIFLTDLDQGSLDDIRQPINPELHIVHPVRRRLANYESKSLVFAPILSIQRPIMAPREGFTKAIVHLADNAFKFSPNKGTVILKVNSGRAGGATITIENQGAGIPASLREKVFERYYQVSQGTTRDAQGLGLGLTIARAVFRLQGGDVKILETAQGCCVEAVLPDIPAEKTAHD
jgi:signal transduction histidine kinase